MNLKEMRIKCTIETTANINLANDVTRFYYSKVYSSISFVDFLLIPPHTSLPLFSSFSLLRSESAFCSAWRDSVMSIQRVRLQRVAASMHPEVNRIERRSKNKRDESSFRKESSSKTSSKESKFLAKAMHLSGKLTVILQRMPKPRIIIVETVKGSA